MKNIRSNGRQPKRLSREVMAKRKLSGRILDYFRKDDECDADVKTRIYYIIALILIILWFMLGVLKNINGLDA